MNEVMENPFDAEFAFKNNWKENLYQQQLRGRLSGLDTKNGNVPPSPSQFLLSPASSATASSRGQCGNSQQHLRQAPVLQCATAQTHALGPHFQNPLTPPVNHQHDAYELDAMLLGLLQPAEQTPPLSSADTAKRQRTKSSTKGASRPSKRLSQHSAPSQNTTPSLSADPPSPEDTKRVVFLERNRKAALKCRAKKKEWTAELEECARELKSSREQHSITIASLKSELVYLKTEVFRHSDCSAAMRQSGKDCIPANPDSNPNGPSNDPVSNVGRIGDESSCLPTTANVLATQEAAIQADDDGDFADDDANECTYSPMCSISNAEFDALRTRQTAKTRVAHRQYGKVTMLGTG
ncbi:hypothetical protein MMC17_000405 [Xylographa soralifera]|nr:hypothetical protein [Xylographa soralifera]